MDQDSSSSPESENLDRGERKKKYSNSAPVEETPEEDAAMDESEPMTSSHHGTPPQLPPRKQKDLFPEYSFGRESFPATDGLLASICGHVEKGIRDYLQQQVTAVVAAAHPTENVMTENRVRELIQQEVAATAAASAAGNTDLVRRVGELEQQVERQGAETKQVVVDGLNQILAVLTPRDAAPINAAAKHPQNLLPNANFLSQYFALAPNGHATIAALQLAVRKIMLHHLGKPEFGSRVFYQGDAPEWWPQGPPFSDPLQWRMKAERKRAYLRKIISKHRDHQQKAARALR